MQKIDFLSKTALELLTLPSTANVYRFIGEKLREVVDDSIVFVNAYDSISGSLVTRALVGVGKYSTALIHLLGRDPIGISFEITDEVARSNLLSGTLFKGPGSVYELTFGGIPQRVAHEIDRLLRIGDTYAIGFSWGGALYGNATISARSTGALLQEKETIEAFIRLASMALQRKEVEDALRESEERHRSIFENSLDGIVLFNSDDRILAANPEACRMHGYTESEILRLGRDDIADTSDPRLRESVEERLRPGCFKGEVTHIRKDRSRFPCEVTTAVFQDKSRQRSRVAIFRDVTERKKAETEQVRTAARVENGERRYRSLFESKSEGFVLFRVIPDESGHPTDFRYLEMNSAWERLTRLSRSDATGKLASEVLPDAIPWDIVLAKHALGSPGAFRIERYSRWAGKWLEYCAYSPGPDLMAVLFTDISERKRAEEVLRESERRAIKAAEVNRTMAELGRIIGSTLRIEEVYEQFAAAVKRIIPFDRIMIALIDDQQQSWTVAYVSGTVVEGRCIGDVVPLTGFIRDLFQKGSGTILHLDNEEEVAEVYPLLLPAFRAGTKSIMASPLISKDQVIGTIQFSSLTPMAYTEEELILAGNVAGQVSGAIANAQLFAKYERSEEALRRSRDELDLRVQERTAELARRNAELQNFTFAASHDLQEPLRKIQTLSDLLGAKYFDSVSEQGRDYLKRMHETATRMRDVLQSLLDFSRLTRTTTPFGRVDLNKIAREAVSDFELLIRETGASVQIEDLPEIEGEAAQMGQLFQNLIGNALKFRRDGVQPLVKIYAVCNSSRGEWEIRVSDNGIGFDEKYLDLIFKPFQRLHGRNEFDGTGMGLAICAKVIEHHEGFITARSVLGEGSTFIVTLPAAVAADERDEA